jgi:CBS domain-containing protein
MTRPRTDELDGMTVADVMHGGFPTMPPSATIGEARAWFAASPSRRLAIVARRSRYVGSLTPADVAGDGDRNLPVGSVARAGAVVAPDASAELGLRLVLAEDARRVPVVDGDGRVCGVLAVTSDKRHFACRDVYATRS